MKIKYKNLGDFIKRNLSNKEDEDTQKLINELKHVRERRYITKDELLKIGAWKARRIVYLLSRNPNKKVIEITKKAFAARDEKERIELLGELKGVGVPVASAVLMLTNPQEYGVIDFWVWKVLYRFGEVRKKPKGRGLNFNDWYTYLAKIRYFAKKFKVKTRDIERTIYFNTDKVL